MLLCMLLLVVVDNELFPSTPANATGDSPRAYTGYRHSLPQALLLSHPARYHDGCILAIIAVHSRAYCWVFIRSSLRSYFALSHQAPNPHNTIVKPHQSDRKSASR